MIGERPEFHIERRLLNNGEYIFFNLNSGEFDHDIAKEGGDFSVRADEFIIARNGPTITAWGGDCPIITFSSQHEKIGALTHIDAASMVSIGGEQLLDVMLATTPQSLKDTEAYICADVSESHPSLVTARQEWVARMEDHLLTKGIGKVIKVLEGKGKRVSLETRQGILNISGDDKRLIATYQWGMRN